MNPAKKIGAVSYLNTRPLIWGLEKLLPQMQLELDLPSRLATRLKKREFEAALIPVVELFSDSKYHVVSDACIACDGPVWSVKLLSRVAPEQIESVALDEGSRTSVCLTRLLMNQYWKIHPQESTLPISADWTQSPTDAVLIIGDRAMNDHSGEFRFQWDLGELWKEWTGLPFVFAVWAAHPDGPLDQLDRTFSQARDLGLAAADQIARDSASKYGMTEQQCLTYLTRHLGFTLGAEQRNGLAHFARLASDNHLLNHPGEIQYHDCTLA